MLAIDTMQNKPMLGTGIYTIPDIAAILRLPYAKVNRWINKFWNDEFAGMYGLKYSWNVDLTRAVNFFTLIEIYTFYRLSQSGIKTKEILKAHNILSEQFQTSYPFANEYILNALRTDGKKVILEENDVTYSVDNHKQTYLNFIREFYKNLDFGDDSLAARLWPLGKDRSVVCDPHHQFGSPVIAGTNINAETLYELYKAGEPVSFIASLYDLEEANVNDAILFCKKAA